MRCEQGDLAHVIKSVDGAAVGKTVQVIRYMGEHSLYGPVWRCRCKDELMTEYGGLGKELDFADDWLEPIKPKNLKVKEVSKELTE